jgi:hypothetical protein
MDVINPVIITNQRIEKQGPLAIPDVGAGAEER